MAPTSFASAAAGTSANSARVDASGDWARRTNGATQTFRRPSHATTPSGSTSSRDPSAPPNSSSSGVYVPPHAQPGRSGSSIDGRYSRDQLTHLLRTQQDSGDLNDSLSSLYMGSWEPQSTNGASGASWGRKDDQGRDTQSGVDQCWDRDGSILPLSLAAMAHDEKEVFLSSVNSPLKPPAQNANKDGIPKEALSLRKTSVSHGAGAPYGLSSPTTARPGARRRDTGEAYPFPSSPATSRFARDESNTVTPPPALVRRRTDFKDSTEGRSTDEREREKGAAETANPFGSLKRTTTGPFNSGGTGSPWSATPGGGFGAFGNFGNPQPDKKAGYGGIRGESRFKGLMGKQSVEEFEKGPKEKGSISNLGILNESEPSKSAGSWMEARSNRPTSNDTDPFPEDNVPSGSAALHGGDDMSPPRPQGSFGTPHRPDPRDDTGFSAFGMTSDNTGLRDIFHGRDNFAHHTPQRGLEGGHEPMSPTNTNPYQSPDHARNDHDNDSDDSDAQQTNYPGMGSFQIDQANPGMHNTFGGLGGLGRINPPFETAPSDRSQTSSVGPTRGFPSIPGLGGLPGLPGLGGSTAWSSNQQALGTPIRERGLGGFESAFSNVGEAQSPSLAGLGNSALFGPASGLGHGTAGRSSRLGSLFPTAMQDQMRSNDPSRPTGDDNSSFGDRQQAMTGTFGRNAFGGQTPGSVLPNRDTDSPFRANRNLFEDFTGASSEDHNGAPFGQNSGAPQASTLATTSLSMAALNHTRTAQPSTPGVNSPASSQPPAPQQRTMVMPDRMRWIYRDPSGNTQGPFSGLEMHDWYKAGFFSPELLVKKQEEPDYEPLAQLIRRIGNSREPFLVPQIGIPHGPPTAQPGNAWAGAGPTAAAPGAQPPFANSFPSFGTTLTAEQQNALERRKQEEQYLMARQKEHLSAQQLALSRQVQMTGMMPNLNHHSSAQSLQSQPSYGSITSPGGYQPSPTQGPAPGAPVPGLLDSTFRGGQGPVPGLGPIGPGGPGMDILSNLRDEDVPAMMDRLSLGRTGQAPFGAAPPQFGQQQHPDARAHQQQVAAMLNDRARLQREQAEHDNLQRQAPNEQQNAQAFADRLQQFNELRLQTDLEQSIKPAEDVIGKPQGSQGQHSFPTSPADDGMQAPEPEAVSLPTHQEPLSLTEQVQKAASAKHSPQPLSAWNKVEPALFPFPPPPSQSPLPAPAAQRKPIVAENLAGESRSGAATPAADTPSASVAPWAKEPAEASRGPSLREIQEAEAKKAAEREAVAAAARREAFEKELLAHSQSPAIQPGLPSSSTWASGASPITPGGATGSSVWAKPLAGKTVTPSTPNSKKTLQQIQREEEARKQRVAAQAAAASGFGIPAPVTAAGKRYADLAGKSSPALPPVSAGNSAWTTVGASGKVKTPGGTTPVPTAVRSTSSTIVPPVVKKPAVSRSVTMGAQSGKLNAEEEFRKWAVNELRHDLNKGIIAEDFVSSLLSFPADAELITESVHSASNTLDSRHFAEEFLRRRKLADKGIIDDRNTSSPADNKSAGSGWSEVAKKGGATLQQQQSASSLVTGDFKVVPSKKKTKR